MKATLSGCTLIALLLLSTHVGAQAYPVKSIRLIIPFAPGGTNDIVGRLIGRKLGEIVEVVAPKSNP